MGAAGTGSGASPMVNSAMARISPQALAMMQAMANTGGAPQPIMPNAGAAPAMAPTPMANFIGSAPNAGAMMQHPAMAPVAPNPAPEPMPNPMQQMTNTAQSMQQMSDLAHKLGAGQSGVAPLPAGQNPEAMSFLQRLLSGFGGAVPPAGGLT